MTPVNENFTRRNFMKTTGVAAAGTVVVSPAFGKVMDQVVGKKKVALVGTGSRGTSLYGQFLMEEYEDVVEFVGLCDINPGRVAYAKDMLGLDCPTFTDFDEMLRKADIDMLMVTTVDSTHDEFIIKGLNRGLDVVTEKPMTTDEKKCQNIIDAQRNSKGRLIMAFNYRYGKLFTKLREIIDKKEIGDLVSVDLHWYLNTYHGADYFRRWHGERDKSGTLLLHKSAHHFDLLNWFIGSDPVEIHAYGALEKYGKNNSFRGDNCRNCDFTDQCEFYYDITKKEKYMKLYVENEKYDGYERDNCLWREEIDIFDKMIVQIKYANNVQVSYSLTTYSPFEGFRIAFNGKDGRLETYEGIPWRVSAAEEDQSRIHEKEMDQTPHTRDATKYHEIVYQRNFEDYHRIEFPYVRSGHWGGDKLMFDEIFRGKNSFDMNHAANVRDGSMAVLIGIAARKSIDEGRAIKIADLTDLDPKAKKWG